MNPFLNYRFHPSMVGDLMTSLTRITDRQLERLNYLQDRHDNSILGLEKVLTDNMKAELLELITKTNAPDTLPAGAITKLDDIFREVVWHRKEIIDSQYLDKGNMTEQDCLDLLSKADRKFYKKNRDTIENDWLIGTPDVRGEKIIDTKASWSMATFDRADLSSLYEWQVKGYLWIDGQDVGEVVYCLVNAPGSMVTDMLNRYWFKYGQPDATDSNWMKLASQIERNMIFDFDLFRKENPNTDLYCEGDTYNVPNEYRIKRYDVFLVDEDIEAFETRLPTCRKYLIDKYDQMFGNGLELELNTQVYAQDD